MSLSAVPFQTSITYVGGRLVVVSRDGEGYRFPITQLEQMLHFFELMLAWANPKIAREVPVGPYLCRPTSECEVELPFQLADQSTICVPVSPDWLERMRPVFIQALEKIAAQPDQPFTLILEIDGTIKDEPPDRTTLRPA